LAKILLIVAVFAAVYFIIRAYARSLNGKMPSSGSRREEDMVRCRHCGVHLPLGESVRADGHFYCSDEHRRSHGA
jgi:uncharacterized protein